MMYSKSLRKACGLVACLAIATLSVNADASDVLRLEMIGLDVTTDSALTSNTGEAFDPVADYSGTITAVDKVSTQLAALDVGTGDFALITPFFSLPGNMAIQEIEIIIDVEFGSITGGSLGVTANNNGLTEIISADINAGQLLYDAAGVQGNTVSYLLSAGLSNITVADDLNNALTTFLGLNVPGPGQLVGNLFEFRFAVTDGLYPVEANAKADLFASPPPPPPVVPLPASSYMGLVMLAMLGVVYIRRRSRAAIAGVEG